jgi:hypothetical protein
VDDEVIFILWTNVPDHLLPLAFGTKACAAGDVPKVPEAWELSASVCSADFIVYSQGVTFSTISKKLNE